MPGDDEPVTYGRWQAEHAALTSRVAALETRVEAAWEKAEAGHAERRTRTWQAILALVTGLVLPLGVLGILALLHLAAR